MGCYFDNIPRDMPHVFTDTVNMNIDLCINHCFSLNFIYAALQYRFENNIWKKNFYIKLIVNFIEAKTVGAEMRMVVMEKMQIPAVAMFARVIQRKNAVDLPEIAFMVLSVCYISLKNIWKIILA